MRKLLAVTNWEDADFYAQAIGRDSPQDIWGPDLYVDETGRHYAITHAGDCATQDEIDAIAEQLAD